MNKINRILIFGNSGSGKSTLAKELENALNIPCYEIDNFRWQKIGLEFLRKLLNQIWINVLQWILGLLRMVLKLL